ncbi:uncharacterized protein At4g14100-like [Vitis riparia]|uniref:uncharacterized protein At4g14100-like n=1 Tax=Vitis riparia TaxID=96939 RepID=UPI00155AAEAF|nr:uncharacterized protein At4g14100-like [Vitis riparia]
MASATKHPAILIVFLIHCLCLSRSSSKSTDPTPTPAPWPPQFYSLLYMNVNGSNQIIDLWYDWPKGRNLNIIQNQLGKRLYDLEWDNGTSFFYTLDSTQECRTKHFEVGILRPDWLDGAHYLGQREVDGFLCNVWEKVDFIWYYEDVVTKRPVHWRFFNGMSAHVMTFKEGAVREDEKWQAPVYCFGTTDPKAETTSAGNPRERMVDGALRGSMSLSM